MKLLEILQKYLKEFPEGMLYAVQDVDGEVKFGKHSQPALSDSGDYWQRREDNIYPSIAGLELAEDWDSAIVTKDMWEKHTVKQIIVNVCGLSKEEKHHVNEALEKITGATKLPANDNWQLARWLFAPASSGRNTVSWDWSSRPVTPTHTPQQVLEMAGIAKKEHVHAESMALYAEDAKITDKPWELWQVKSTGEWNKLLCNPSFSTTLEYRRKPKTHIVNGIEVPDLRIAPKKGERFYLVDPTEPEFTYGPLATSEGNSYDSMWIKRGLCYENTEEGKQAAILHAKAWLGIV